MWIVVILVAVVALLAVLVWKVTTTTAPPPTSPPDDDDDDAWDTVKIDESDEAAAEARRMILGKTHSDITEEPLYDMPSEFIIPENTESHAYLNPSTVDENVPVVPPRRCSFPEEAIYAFATAAHEDAVSSGAPPPIFEIPDRVAEIDDEVAEIPDVTEIDDEVEIAEVSPDEYMTL
jgi:hypothetical protein